MNGDMGFLGGQFTGLREDVRKPGESVPLVERNGVELVPFFLRLPDYAEQRDQSKSYSSTVQYASTLQPLRPAFCCGHQRCEAPKIAVQKNHIVAILRGVVHFVPILFVIALILLNCVGTYVGAGLKWLPFLLYVSKVVDILILISISAAFLAYLRHELIHDGLPFGAVFAGLQITMLSYLWSLEFWGSVTSSVLRGRRKLLFVTFVTFSVLLAAAVGPSLGVAILPRRTEFPAGTTLLWLSATGSQIYASNLTVTDVPPNCSSSTTLSLVGSGCPSSEWPAIAQMLAPLYYGYTWTGFQTPATQRQLWLDITTLETINSVWVTTPQAAVAEALQNIGDLWDAAVSNYSGTGDNPSRFGSNINVFHVVEALQPYVVTRCLQNNVDSFPLQFPTRQYSWSSDEGHWSTFHLSGYPAITAMESSYQIHWVDLPPADFRYVSIGAIIQPPNTVSPLADPRPVACSIYAGWGMADVNLTTTSEYIRSDFKPSLHSIDNFLRSIDWVSIPSDWAAYLTPPLSDQNSTVDAAIYSTLGENLYLENENASHPAYIHEAVLGCLIANGMARNRFPSGIVDNPENYQSELPVTLSNQSIKQWLSGANKNPLNITFSDAQSGYALTVNSTVTGVAYTTDHVPIKIALAVLVVYCVFAVGHLLYAAISGISSNSWSTIAELTALALASTAPENLRNTTAGIATAGVFKDSVRVVATEGNLELVFQGDLREMGGFKEVEVNRAY